MKANQVQTYKDTLLSTCLKNGFSGIELRLNLSKTNIYNFQTYDFHPRRNNCVIIDNGNCIIDYEKYIKDELKMDSSIQTIFFDFDNRARLLIPDRLHLAMVTINNTIEYQQLYCRKIANFFKNYQNKDEEPMLLINAWNEWGEKMHLEPSAEKGNFYLRMLKYYFIQGLKD